MEKILQKVSEIGSMKSSLILEVLKRLLKGTTKSPFRRLTVKPSFVRHVLNRQSLAWLHCFAEKLGLL